MRINVTGETSTAKAIRGLLNTAGFVVTPHFADFRIDIEEWGAGILFDSVSCPLEAAIFKHTRPLSGAEIRFVTNSGNLNDNRIRIAVGESEVDRRAVELGVLRGLLDMPSKAQPLCTDCLGKRTKSFWQRLKEKL